MVDKGEGYTHNMYAGADYGFDPSYGKEFSAGSFDYAIKPSEFGFTTDARTANQLEAVSKKLNTGAKTLEVQGVSPQVLESIPNQHLTEINRLKKLVGVDLTFHGPILEPTGITRRNWNESHREETERQMWSAVERAHKLDPKGNIVVTFHSGAAPLDPETIVKTEVINPKTGKKEIKEQIKEYAIVNELDGDFQRLEFKPDYFKSKEEEYFSDIKTQEKILKDKIDDLNKSNWREQLQRISFQINNGEELLDRATGRKTIFREGKEIVQQEKDIPKEIYNIYGDYKKGKDVSKQLKEYEYFTPDFQAMANAENTFKNSYHVLQQLFNEAYISAKKDNQKDVLKKLDAYREEIKPNLKDIEDPSRLKDFADEIQKGLNLLSNVQPTFLRPLKEFVVDKAGDTFSGIAFSAYKKFKDTSPIISIENPPAGTAPIYRAEDLRELIKQSREKLQRKLVDEIKMPESEAKRQAEKLIGATWDVGHINMIKKFGYGDKDLAKETEKIAPFVKHIHLSDNFGMDHTELPMGMGNVPTKKMLDLIQKENANTKKIVETGNWWEPFKITPFKETLRAFGSPIYGMQGPYWNAVANTVGGYFSGYGTMLPEQHFSMYGAGFAGLPTELGGQVGGGRSRLSGTPNE